MKKEKNSHRSSCSQNSFFILLIALYSVLLLNSDSRKMELYGMETLSNSSNTLATFAICGGIPSGLGESKILAGYSISSLQTICDNNSYDLKSLNYVLTNNGKQNYLSCSKI